MQVPSRSGMARAVTPALSLVVAAALAGCSLGGGSADRGSGSPADADGSSSTDGPQTGSAGTEVVLVTHDSFALPDPVLAAFTSQTGYTLTVQPSGDAGELTNQLVLTKGSPIGDVVFGIDSTFASRAVEEGVLAQHTPDALPPGAEDFALPGGDAAYLTPVDYGDVCVNIDDSWFAREGIEPPQTLEDLTDPRYRDLFVTPGATSSSPGLAFLLATVEQFGEDGWQDYWRDLVANGAKVTSGWTDAYTVDFTAGGGGGSRPIVLSYASSPPFTIPQGEQTPTTSALLDTCFRQVEYAGVLEGAANPEGAAALVDFLLTEQVQEAIPDAMYVFPVSAQAPLPALWARWATLPEQPHTMEPARIEANREAWVRAWADLATG